MKLPDRRPWVSLFDAYGEVLDHFHHGEIVAVPIPIPAHSEPERFLKDAFEYGGIKTRGRDTRKPDRTIPIPEVYWQEAEVDWDNSVMSSPGDVFEGDITYHDVEVSNDELIKYIRVSVEDTKKSSKDEIGAPSTSTSRRGRKPKYDWDAFYVEIAVSADLDELPETQAELERKMSIWCLDTWGEQPSESTLRTKIASIYNHRRKTEGQ